MALMEGPICPNCNKSLKDNLGFETLIGKKEFIEVKKDSKALLNKAYMKTTFREPGDPRYVDYDSLDVPTIEEHKKIEENLYIFYCKNCGHPIHLVSDYDKCHYS
jgi:hypothetical protein